MSETTKSQPAATTVIAADAINLPERLDDAAIAATLATELKLRPTQTLATLKLLDEGSTVPFITRYRKEATGGLDEVQIQAVADRADALRTLHSRKRDVLRLIAEQGRLTEELAASITGAQTLQAVEDLYLPYRPKRRPAPAPPASADCSLWRTSFCGRRVSLARQSKRCGPRLRPISMPS